jgi:hypothetical protein
VHLLENYAVEEEGMQALLNASLRNTSLAVLEIDDFDDDGLFDPDRLLMTPSLEINRFRKTYLELDRATISPYLYPRIFARVSTKPSVLFLFLQESRGMFIPHLRTQVEQISALIALYHETNAKPGH